MIFIYDFYSSCLSRTHSLRAKVEFSLDGRVISPVLLMCCPWPLPVMCVSGLGCLCSTLKRSLPGCHLPRGRPHIGPCSFHCRRCIISQAENTERAVMSHLDLSAVNHTPFLCSDQSSDGPHSCSKLVCWLLMQTCRQAHRPSRGKVKMPTRKLPQTQTAALLAKQPAGLITAVENMRRKQGLLIPFG